MSYEPIPAEIYKPVCELPNVQSASGYDGEFRNTVKVL